MADKNIRKLQRFLSKKFKRFGLFIILSLFFPFEHKRYEIIFSSRYESSRVSSIVTSSTFIVDSLIFYFLAYYSPHNLFYLYNIVQLILCSLSHSTSIFSFAKNFSSYLQFTIIAFTNIIIHISLSLSRIELVQRDKEWFNR